MTANIDHLIRRWESFSDVSVLGTAAATAAWLVGKTPRSVVYGSVAVSVISGLIGNILTDIGEDLSLLRGRGGSLKEVEGKAYRYTLLGRVCKFSSGVMILAGIGAAVAKLLGRMSATSLIACTITAIFVEVIGITLIGVGNCYRELSKNNLVVLDPKKDDDVLLKDSWWTRLTSWLPESSRLHQGQPPGLKNLGLTCFMNASFQALFSLPLYRQALKSVAEKECSYRAAWKKLHDAVLGEDAISLWGVEEIQRVYISLISEQKNDEHLDITALSKDCLTELAAFMEADQKGMPWPVPTNPKLIDEFIGFFKKDKKTFQKKSDLHLKSYKPFAALSDLIDDYERREKLLEGEVEKLSDSDVRTSSKIPLQDLYEFLPKERGGQQDVGEFIAGLFKRARLCEYPDFFFTYNHEKNLTHYLPREPDSTKLDPLPKDGKIQAQIRDFMILLNLSEEMTGDELLGQNFSVLATKFSEEDKLKNLTHYEEGDYYVSAEGYQFNIFPDQLIIGCTRHSYNQETRYQRKIDTKIHFSEKVVIQGQPYEIHAVINHSGTSYAGHYITHVHKNGQWWCCNDENVSLVTKDSIIKALSKGYIYILKKLPEESVE